MTLRVLVLVSLAAQSPVADSLPSFVHALSDSALVAQARTAPLTTRDAVTDALRAGDIAAARRLAAAYAVAWADSFPAREVARFAAWRPPQQAARLWADSVRRAGIAAYSRDGATPAIALWRRALVRAQSLGDTALMGAVIGNIGAGFLREGALDSAEAYLNRARTVARAVGDMRVEANALVALAFVNEDRGELARAREHHARALVLHERIGDTRGVAASRNNLGLLAWTSGDRHEARRQFEAALAMNRREGRDELAARNLVNLAGLATLAGDFAGGQRLYRDALATWRAREEWAEAAGALHGLGELELRRGDYAAARTALRRALEIYDRTGPLADGIAVRRSLAGALSAQGELQGALDVLRDADDRANAAGTGAPTTAGIALARADMAVRLNTFAEAERLYSRAEQLFREAADPNGEADAQHGLGLMLLERNDHNRANSLLSRALRVQEGAGDTRAAALTRIALANAARSRGDTGRAREQLARAAAELEKVGDPVALAAVMGEQAALVALQGRPAAAEALYGAALQRLGQLAAPEVAWRLHAGRAHARRALGATDAAAQSLQSAVAEIERAGRSLRLPERRAGYLADKWDAYAQLALLERGRGKPQAAFEASERLRAREMFELLGRGRVAAPGGSAGELIGREQDLRRHIAELTDDFEAASGAGPLRGPGFTAAGTVVREELLAAQQAYAELLLEIRDRQPRYATLVSREVADWRDVARRLRTDEAFVKYLVSDSGSVAFVVARNDLSIVDLGITRRELARLVAFARGTVEAPRPGSDSLWLGPFRRLHRHLIAPLEEAGLLRGMSRLLLVPHAEMHYLPFAALMDERGRGPLVQRYEIMTTPSATVWLALGDRPVRRTNGVLAMAPRPNALPGSRREAAAVARLTGTGSRALTGNDATEAAFLLQAPGKRVVHLATYGVLNQHNPLFSFVELAPGAGHDGRLEVHEVFGLELAAEVVVLSACQTAVGSGRLADVPPGDDWVGLTRAFLHAGARSVVATLWAVDDAATAALMEEFYRRHTAGADPPRALARAQRALSARRGTAHPFHWAGVVVVQGSGP